jgi:hypothetical protein
MAAGLISVKLRASTICKKRCPTGDLEVDTGSVTGVEVPEVEGVNRRVVEEISASEDVIEVVVLLLLVESVVNIKPAAALVVDGAAFERVFFGEASETPDPERAALLDFLTR